jgi:deazaflavin-dependent oxidoreductase (nitroreductase family)
VTTIPPRIRRIVGRALRAPAALDRPGLRWALRVVSPVPVAVLVHRGRRSGRIYKTPVEAIVDDAERGEIVIAPMWGERESDWYRNVVAGGLVEVHLRGEVRRVEWRKLSPDECRAANSSYLAEHPIYGRAVLRMLMWIHGRRGDAVEGVSEALPMLALRRVDSVAA